jgi:signal transduction histidine kinase
MVDSVSPAPGAAAGRRRGLRRLFARLSFRTKFIVVGLVVAGPLFLLAGFAAATFDQEVRRAQARELALQQSERARALMVAVATHRGLSARVLAGGEGLSSELVRQQREMMAMVGPMVDAFSTPEWQAIGLPDPESVAEELRALLVLPDARNPGRNFERHNEVIDALLAVVYRTGNRVAATQKPTEGGTFDLSFVTLPALMEDLGRMRGWGSGVLQEQGWSEFETRQHLMYAGAARQRLVHLRADRHTLREVQDLIGRAGEPNPLVQALNRADAFSRRSLAVVLAQEGGDDASEAHFAEGTAAIAALNAVNRALADTLVAATRDALARAERGRAASIAALVLLLLALAWVYREFERSTVLRLRTLQSASGRLARGEFDARVPVEGSDEIAQLASALDTMRERLRSAVDDSAEALAARESDRAKTDFLARWSHDLRTPLTAVLGFARLLGERGGGLNADQRADLAHIQSAGQHLLALVNDVLEIAQAEAGGVVLADEPIALAPLLAESQQLLRPVAAEAGVTLHAPGPGAAALWVQGDRTRLLQVMGNLLSNAVKFNQRGGEVRIEVGVRAVATAAAPAPAAPGPWVEVTVQDNGPGIAAELLPRLFQPFERLDAAQRGIPGSGLGLATARRLVERMGGEIAVRSTPGAGSRFTLVLRGAPAAASVHLATPAPLTSATAVDDEADGADGAVGAVGAHAPAADARSGLCGRVVYVEDNPVNVMLMQAMLAERTAIELSICTTAAEALADPGPYALWIIDRQLPDGDGITLLAELRARHGAGLRAVMFSADALPELRARALEAGFLDHWTKPLELEDLLAALRRLLPPAA